MESQMKIEYVNISDLQPSTFNPPQRTDTGAIADLLKDIAANGILVPLIVSSTNVIIDGHRRYVCAKALNINIAPVIRHPVVTQAEMMALWWEVNRSRRKLSPAEVTWFYVNGGKIDGDVANEIRKLEATIGIDGVRKIADMKNVSPSIAGEASKVAHYCSMAKDMEFRARVVWWLIEHKQRLAVRHVMELDGPAESIIKAVNEDRPIKVVYL